MTDLNLTYSQNVELQKNDPKKNLTSKNTSKKAYSYYPFGLEHRGYNNVVSSNANSVGEKFKFNGVELEEGLGLSLYEMDVRSYDPTIARFTSIDPVIHFDYSPYQAFDNNPIYWADPSGADSTSFIQELFDNTPSDGRVHHYNGEGEKTGTSDPNEEAEEEEGSTSASGEEGDHPPGGMHPVGMERAAEQQAKANGTSVQEEREKLLRKYGQSTLGTLSEILLMVSGEYVIVKVFQGSKWVYLIMRGNKTSVIGPRGVYRQFAKKIGANFLNVSDDAWTWSKNKKFLEGIVKRGDDVVFAGKFDATKLKSNSVLAREIQYLIKHGYKWSDDFSKLIKQ